MKQPESIAIAEPQYGLVSLEQSKPLTGLEFLQAMLEGKFPLPPISKTLQFRLVEIEKGRALFTSVPVIDFYNPLGTVHGGYDRTLPGFCKGFAVLHKLPSSEGYTPLEFQLKFLPALKHLNGLDR